MNFNVKYQNPFEVERLRNVLSKSDRLSKFKSIYFKNYPNILDQNTSNFWNKKILKNDRKLLESKIYQNKLRIASRYVLKKRGKILDIGFGYGYLEQRLSKSRNVQLYGIDKSSLAVTRAKKNLQGTYKIGNILKIPFESNQFDVVIALDVMEHIIPNKTFESYHEVSRVLTKTGTFIISVPVNEDLEKMVKRGTNPNGHVRVYTQSILLAELKIANFKVLKVISLKAFKNLYFLKKIVTNFLPSTGKNPNLLIIIAQKK